MVNAAPFGGLLSAWGSNAVAGEPRPGLHDVEVRSVRLGELECVGRWSQQSAESLDWEFEVQDSLSEAGIVVPKPIPTLSGKRHYHGIILTPKLPGPHPAQTR